MTDIIPPSNNPSSQTPCTEDDHHDDQSSRQSSPQTGFIRTSTQTYISRSANVIGAPNVHTKGKSVLKSGVTLHGDYGAPIHIGRYCFLEEGVVIMPTVVPCSSDPLLDIDRSSLSSPPLLSSSAAAAAASILPPSENEKALPLLIGSHTRIGPKSVIQSLSIGSSVRIGSNCILCHRSVIKDCCIIESNTVIPPDMTVPPFSRVRGNPGRIVGCLPECTGGEFVECCVQDYVEFVRGLDEGEK